MYQSVVYWLDMVNVLYKIVFLVYHGHMKARKWNIEQLKAAAEKSFSIRQVIQELGLIPAGGNYVQIQRTIKENNIDINHFTGHGWKRNRTFEYSPRTLLDDIFSNKIPFQSFKLKKRLFAENLKMPKCELCGWAKQAIDGRIPVELDHINGNRNDNRLENLRILCPNCHSLQSTHRGLNIKAGVMEW